MTIYKSIDLDKLIDLAYDTGWLAAKLELVGCANFSDEELKSTCEHQQEMIKERELLRRRLGLRLNADNPIDEDPNAHTFGKHTVLFAEDR